MQSVIIVKLKNLLSTKSIDFINSRSVIYIVDADILYTTYCASNIVRSKTTRSFFIGKRNILKKTKWHKK